jgi:hypothetical protein
MISEKSRSRSTGLKGLKKTQVVLEMRKNMKKFYVYLFAVLFLVIQQEYPAYSDTVKLTEGSVLVGKIIYEDREKITISNAYGTFNVKKTKIANLYKTEVYTEDLKVLKKLKVKVNEKGIKKHIEAGQKKKDELEEDAAKKKEKEKLKKPGNLWTNGTIHFSGSFNYVLDEVSGKIPFGYSGHFAFDQGMDMITGQRYLLMPGLRLEGGYLKFSKGDYDISAYNSVLGLIWKIPVIKNKYGYFVFAAMPGIAILDVENSNTGRSAKSNTFCGASLAGYRLPLGSRFNLFLHARYMYIYDEDVLFHTIGADVGFGFRLW